MVASCPPIRILPSGEMISARHRRTKKLAEIMNSQSSLVIVQLRTALNSSVASAWYSSENTTNRMMVSAAMAKTGL